MQGTPYIYQGEELGMTNVKFDSIEDYRDGDSIRFYEDMHVDHKRLSHEEAMQAIYIKGRDNARTPVQWDASANGGFSPEGVTPWIAVNPNYPAINAEAVLADEDSIFYHYQQLFTQPSLRWIRFRFRTTRMRLCTRTPVPVVRMAAPRTSLCLLFRTSLPRSRSATSRYFLRLVRLVLVLSW